jgi:hypothetical protein
MARGLVDQIDDRPNSFSWQTEPGSDDPFDAGLIATNPTTASTRTFPVSEPEPLGASQLDVELMRQIDAVCRRFQADWRCGRKPRPEGFLAQVPEAAGAALVAELDALERELRRESARLRGRSPPPSRTPPQSRRPVCWTASKPVLTM